MHGHTNIKSHLAVHYIISQTLKYIIFVCSFIYNSLLLIFSFFVIRLTTFITFMRDTVNIRKWKDMYFLQISNVVNYTSFQIYIYHVAETLFCETCILCADMGFYRQVSFLCDFFLRDFVWTRLENLHYISNLRHFSNLRQFSNLHHFSNLRDNVRFNAIWHGEKKVASHILCWRLAESDVTVTPLVTCMD
jgi:hypothetical protein